MQGFKETHQIINSFIKKILCTSNQENFISCDECKSCKSFEANSNPDFLEIMPDEKIKSGLVLFEVIQIKTVGL
ncbi:MAG: hypothetical protein CM15mP40_13870 [Alphaproteobacteria bacterium]|nr:MAG: hypothetical protein CM15mP40_13870 [Alphaproteobacteria bacterium]